jgi:hypothetical protein
MTIEPESEPEHQHDPHEVQMRNRMVFHLDLDGQETFIGVDHVYAAEGSITCEHCGRPGHDPGFVGLMLGEEHALLDPGEALMLAERLQRAASLVMESMEDVPDIEREAARYSVPEEPGSSTIPDAPTPEG